MTTPHIAIFVVRCGLVMLFLPFSALDKTIGFAGAVRQAQDMFKSRPLAIFVILCGLGVEVVMSFGIVTGVADRMAALIMAAYCATTAVLFKRFWSQGDLWAEGESKGRGLFWDFIKNLSLGAGFLLIVIGTDGSALSPFLSHPFASSHPYTGSEAR